MALLCVKLLLLGCAGAETSHEPGALSTEAPATEVANPIAPEQAEYWTAWKAGPHAATYGLEKGPNTYCAQCHSPGNWDPLATIDPPPNCVSCKFTFEEEPRVAVGNPLVAEDEWKSIGCTVCHPTGEDGVVSGEIAWHDPVSGYYETVADSTALCSRCHRDTETLRHSRAVGGTHADFTCTDCHDAHSAAASCSQAGCHSQADAAWQEHHNDVHTRLACVACHDATGLEVGPVADGAGWMAFRTTELLGRANTEPYHSHQLQREVSCQRCHYPDNPWGLERVDDA